MTVRTVPATDFGYQAVQCLTKVITWTDAATAVVVGTIPAGATIVGGGVHITTAFAAGATNTIDVGYAGHSGVADDPNGLATVLTPTGVGFIALDELAATTNIMSTKDLTITATYNGGTPTAGVGKVIIMFVA